MRFYTNARDKQYASTYSFLKPKKKMKVEVLIAERRSLGSEPHQHVVVDETAFIIELIGRDEECRKLWSTPVIDSEGEIKKYISIHEAMLDAPRQVSHFQNIFV